MAKIKISLEGSCSHYRLLEDGELIDESKPKCDRNWVPPEGFDEKFDEMRRKTKDVSRLKTKEERKAKLLKELQELESSD